MSYCRWSDTSDIYCYHGGSYMIHIAGDCPDAINKLYEGQTLSYESLAQLKEAFLNLKQLGYRFPERVFDRINRELM